MLELGKYAVGALVLWWGLRKFGRSLEKDYDGY